MQCEALEVTLPGPPVLGDCSRPPIYSVAAATKATEKWFNSQFDSDDDVAASPSPSRFCGGDVAARGLEVTSPHLAAQSVRGRVQRDSGTHDVGFSAGRLLYQAYLKCGNEQRRQHAYSGNWVRLRICVV